MIWLAISLLLLAAIGFIAWPLYRQKKTTAAAVSAAGVAAVALGLYLNIGSPVSEPPEAELPGIDQVVLSLAARLAENPEDLAGWKMLGRSYMQLRQFPQATAAFEKAIQLEGAGNAQTLADLGEVLLLEDQQAIAGRAAGLFESALAIEPNNPKALFYAGMAALNRGDRELAAARWEALLATSPPQNIQDILQQRIAELRGTEPTEPAPAAAVPASVVSVQVELSDAAKAAAPGDATVFVIARDPAQPSPPIAAVRRRVSELPAIVEIGDTDAMIPGRVPSGFAQLEIVARISMSGQPIAQPGDWFGDLTVVPKTGEIFSVVIDGQVP
jgi:cytochrome c-type biogenesis protein CcmH